MYLRTSFWNRGRFKKISISSPAEQLKKPMAGMQATLRLLLITTQIVCTWYDGCCRRYEISAANKSLQTKTHQTLGSLDVCGLSAAPIFFLTFLNVRFYFKTSSNRTKASHCLGIIKPYARRLIHDLSHSSAKVTPKVTQKSHPKVTPTLSHTHMFGV